MATLSLAEERLPDVVARLNRGEKVDVESATPPLDYGEDELGQVAKAFNTAQRTAVYTAVELADTRRGFQKVILGIARQSQNLVNLQLSKLDALEREHQDPGILKGLYELDSTASQLRRYEENLVIISGEQPRRSWTEPVALIDILRSAVGEVAQYQRVDVHTDDEVYLSPPAVADVIHLLAELIDNATTYSPRPARWGCGPRWWPRDWPSRSRTGAWASPRRTTPRSTPSWRWPRSSTWWHSPTTCGSACS